MSRGPVLAALLAIAALAVLAQAVLAGMFLSGTPGARMAHTVVGFVLPYYALVVAVLAAFGRRKGPARAPAPAVYLLPVLLWVQEVLGHLPFPWSTVVHVPLGVLLFAGALHLAISQRGASPPSG